MKPAPDDTLSSKSKPRPGDEIPAQVCSHLRFGWWSILVFLTLGLVLETLHGFKIGWYVNVSTQTRRLLFTLAHAHGALFGLLNIAFALTLAHLPGWSGGSRRFASASLKAGTVLLPGGFFLGGLVIHGGDPGLGILLVPLGALFLLIAAFLTARAVKPASARIGVSR